LRGGIVKVDAERKEVGISKNGAISLETEMVWRVNAVYIPLGSKVSLVPLAVTDGYKMLFFKDDGPNPVIYADKADSYQFNKLETVEIGIYTKSTEGSYTPDDTVDIVVVNEPSAKLATPFIDIGYFGEEYKTRALYNQKVLIAISQELREDIEWAYANGVASGTSAVTFSPFSHVTRAQMVQMLWNYSGKPEPQYTGLPFTDVEKTDWYYKALCWAHETGVLENMRFGDAFRGSWAVAPFQVVNALNNLFNCKLPDAVYDGELTFNGKQTCLRVNFVHYLHYAHQYAAGTLSASAG